MFRKIAPVLVMLLVPTAFVHAQAPSLENPSGSGAMAPGLTALPGGSAAILSWIEKDGEDHVLKLSRFEGDSFAEAGEIARVADGVVVGSVLVELVAEHGADAPARLRELTSKLAGAVRSAR